MRWNIFWAMSGEVIPLLDDCKQQAHHSLMRLCEVAMKFPDCWLKRALQVFA